MGRKSSNTQTDANCSGGAEHHRKLDEGRYYCELWDETVDFSIDPWDPDDDCPWCGDPFERHPHPGGKQS